ncbi:MAG: bifunctional glutamate N-acetyltransferase/amino-acid acetyltransferase ArgJ [Verrucomicrobia bacterium]|nr:bifunctional glutamate N-acetyltransferase/amino-acid acetyltransferase ArgJ [Verrucomicrobiota bacterium]MDA1065908.1 bifunctional glutamate N-acetyltransferase/amino-acid acetyltransferase ArgJ [Verrucomicrobiota bacterium]
MTPKGFTSLGKFIGIKEKNNDFALIVSEVEANAAAVFTRSTFCGAPVTLGKELIKAGKAQAFLITSGISNVATGQQGLDNARQEMEAVGAELEIEPNLVLPNSTGVIGVQLPMGKILKAISGCKDALRADNWEATAEAIMTTDTHSKLVRRKVGNAVLIGMAKGAGMIEPNMATMLSFWVTDADIQGSDLQALLKRVVDKSFNCLSIDTDTSTSDTVAIMANGLAGKVDLAEFEAAFLEAAVILSKQIVFDGEGATKLIEVVVSGAVDEDQAKKMAKSVVNSPLVKTAVYGADANWGRVAMALGKTFDERLEPEKLKISFGEHTVYDNGAPTNISDDPVEAYLKEAKEVVISVNLGIGNSTATVWGCDLSEGYIKVNALYRT